MSKNPFKTKTENSTNKTTIGVDKAKENTEKMVIATIPNITEKICGNCHYYKDGIENRSIAKPSDCTGICFAVPPVMLVVLANDIRSIRPRVNKNSLGCTLWNYATSAEKNQ